MRESIQFLIKIIKSKKIFFYISLCNLLFLTCIDTVTANQEVDLNINDQDLTIMRYPANGKQLIIWVSLGFEEHKRAFDMSSILNELGIEIWHVDLAKSLYLSNSRSTMRKLTGEYVAGLIEYAYLKTGKQITLFTRSYGAISVLRGARTWQKTHVNKKNDYLNGAILFSPDLYSAIPSLGLEPEYVSIISATNIPIVLYQGGARGNRWQLDFVLKKLQQGGSQVYVKIQAGVIGMFNEKDKTPTTLSALHAFPKEIKNILNLLQKTLTPKKPAPFIQKYEFKERAKDISLMPFKGNSIPPMIDLVGIDGNRMTINNYKGKVTVVNFWATWCPPCVEEIPSLNKLRLEMKNKPFELISINYAEGKEDIYKFMQKIKIDFPVLLDNDGLTASKWNVLVFPSTFIIDKEGNIRYGVNAAIHFDKPEIVAKINQLIKE